MIYLDAIRSNYHYLRSQLPEECVFYVVLKSDAYGHGITEVSNALIGAGCQHFAVGNLLEAIQIRKQGIKGEILLLNPIPSWVAETAVFNDLSVSVMHPSIIQPLEDACEAMNKTCRIHLKVNVGLNRLGIAPSKLIKIAKEAFSKPHLRFEGLYAQSRDPASARKGFEKIKTIYERMQSEGIAPELASEDADVLPVAVCLFNSIGVMQVVEGAVELFKSMRHTIEDAGRIMIISAYQQEYVASYALGQYESTLDVSGQPMWMLPNTYASEEYRQVSRAYKRAYSEDPGLTVDVFDTEDNLVKKGHKLTRDPDAVRYAIDTGKIRTFTDYRSNWCSFNQFEDWIRKFWSGRKYHVKTKELDAIRAEPVQMTILDSGDNLEGLFTRLG